ncbi:MAG: metal-dependent hydrolase, partial [Haloarculaceae archaeon]
PMLPWGHAAVGYLLLSGVRRGRGRSMTAAAAVTVLLATQIPDAIDKPLAWTVPLLPNGRSLAHSLPTGVLGFLAVILAVALRRRHLVGVLAVGYLAHPLADALHPVLELKTADLAFLAWPVLPPVEYEGPKNFAGHLLGIDPIAPFFLFQLVLVVIALVTWHRDGRPGLVVLSRAVRERRAETMDPAD